MCIKLNARNPTHIRAILGQIDEVDGQEVKCGGYGREAGRMRGTGGRRVEGRSFSTTKSETTAGEGARDVGEGEESIETEPDGVVAVAGSSEGVAK